MDFHPISVLQGGEGGEWLLLPVKGVLRVCRMTSLCLCLKDKMDRCSLLKTSCSGQGEALCGAQPFLLIFQESYILAVHL